MAADTDTQPPPQPQETNNKEEKQPKPEPQTYKECEKRAKDDYQDSKYSDAIKYYRQAITLADDTQTADKSRLHSNIAQCYLKLENYIEAYHSANTSLSFDSNNFKSTYRLGLILLHFQQYDLAQQTLERACTLDVYSKAAHDALTKVFEARENNENGCYDWIDIAEKYRTGKFLTDYHGSKKEYYYIYHLSHFFALF